MLMSNNSNNFKSGRLLAYKLMCTMTVRRQDSALSQEYLTHFYRLLHIGLTGTDQVERLVYLFQDLPMGCVNLQ